MNKTTLYVGNLPRTVSKEDLALLLGHHARVHSVRLIRDRRDGRPRGYAFVEVEAADAQRAITILNGSLLQGREITVSEALPRSASAEARRG